MTTGSDQEKCGAVSVGMGIIGSEEMVLLDTHSKEGSVCLSPACARFVALQLIQWADYLEPEKKEKA